MLDLRTGCFRGEPTEERRETGCGGACRGALGGLSASEGRRSAIDCPEGGPRLPEPREPMRSSSARKVSLASRLAPRPSMDLVRRWPLPAGAIEGW